MIRTAPPGTLGGHTAGQLLRLCEAAGLGGADATGYARTLTAALGPAAGRSLDLPPPTRSFLSDDHTPVEFSISFAAGAAPTLRVLLEPGSGVGGLAQSGRDGLRVVRELARRWDFATDRLDELEDLFFPPSPQGPLALWCALELRSGGVPKVKVYLNPAASGAARAAETVREALRRLGHRQAFTALPEADRLLFFALDLGDWEEPRVKVYTAHHGLSAAAAGGLSRMVGGPDPAGIEAFFRAAAGIGDDQDTLLDRRPVQACHAFTETATGLPGGFTLYVPVRDYIGHDGEALDRTVALLRRHGIDPAQLLGSLAAVTSRRLEEGAGLIAYLALAHQRGRPPRVMVYLSSEAYRVRPPAVPSPRAEAVH
ncbi:tryptophan dimethylallyltransferase family protein [Kitasatospora sp. NPDC052896]|uniref:tryptophan dimethylallyltransferase family protein n=1 Tax=Kitasatospora sp. NPDC052896 TaxID=3364061 RepID=UPI0037CB8D9D